MGASIANAGGDAIGKKRKGGDICAIVVVAVDYPSGRKVDYWGVRHVGVAMRVGDIAALMIKAVYGAMSRKWQVNFHG